MLNINSRPILSLENISKVFPGVRALDNASLNLYPGEVMSLIGENGAGKSTIVKVIAGIHSPTTGSIKLNNKLVSFKGVKDSIKQGISVVHQELKLLQDLTVAENIFLNREIQNKIGIINWKKMHSEATKYLEILGVSFDSRTIIKNLSIGQQQMVEIAKSLSLNSKIILFDEPTDSLTDIETNELFKVIENLKKENVAMLYISHRMSEIEIIAERVSIFRDGKFIIEKLKKDITTSEIINHMVGRSLVNYYPKKFTMDKKLVLSVRGLQGDKVKNCSFDAYSGEILGISGLMGAGRTESFEMMIGYTKKNNGTIILKNKVVNWRSPSHAIKNKVYYLSEDRRQKGLLIKQSIKQNITISSLDKISKNKLISSRLENKIARQYSAMVNVKSISINQIVSNLSGGNQQKVAIAKALLNSPDVLIIDEPTRGIDVGARKEIYEILFELKKQGVCIIVITSDLPELLGISDRILVMANGVISGELITSEATESKIMKLAIKTGMEE